MKKKLLFIIMAILSIVLCTGGVYAASATITAAKTAATVGDKVKVTVKVVSAAWNLKVSGSASGDIIGFNMDGENQTVTQTYTVSCKKSGTYTVKLSGDITDGKTDKNSIINKSVTITVKEKQTSTTTNNNNTTNGNTTTDNKPATTKKSSNANISKITLNVEGLSFKTSQTTYNITVGEDIDNIKVGVSLAHKKATYTISGNKNLKAGDNVIKIVVTAEDGTKKTYKINVKKQGNEEESSAYLSNLIIENMSFEKAFESTETEYVGSKMKYTDSLNVLPYPVSEDATYKIIGNENLKEGKNVITIKVTSADKTNTVEYKVAFEMMSKSETNALQVVNPYVEVEPNTNTVPIRSEESPLVKAIREHSTIILLYVLALIEFAQVIYLYVQLKNTNPDITSVRRRDKNKK